MPASAPPQVVGVVAAAHRPAAVGAAREALRWLEGHGVAALVEAETAAALGCRPAPDLRDADLILVLGGDGTVISTAREASLRAVPVIGVNFGTFGFLAEIEAEQLAPALAALVEGRYEVERRLMLTAEVAGCGGEEAQTAVAANDVAVKAGDPSHVLELRVHANGDLIAEFPADGLLVATPTGSTAYNLSAGGPVVVPGVEAFVLTPICPHTLATRPLVLAADCRVTVELAGAGPRRAVVSVDGRINLPLSHDQRLTVGRAEAELYLARLRPSAFFDSLRGKLRWGKPK